ncbi:MAG TPA: response regulator [Armatimonadota bacterium]|jgi:CheY-like chemotaxis protein
MRILVVDDEPIVREVLGECLLADGHEVSSAESGSEALNRLEANPFDLVITDQTMPGMSGDVLAKGIKARLPSLPVFLLTGLGAQVDAEGHAPDGIDRVLSKPISVAALRQAVASIGPGAPG